MTKMMVSNGTRAIVSRMTRMLISPISRFGPFCQFEYPLFRYNDQCFEGQRLYCSEFLHVPGLFSCDDGPYGDRRHGLSIKALQGQPPQMSQPCWKAILNLVPRNGSSKQPAWSMVAEAQYLSLHILEYPPASVANAVYYSATLCPFLSAVRLTRERSQVPRAV